MKRTLLSRAVAGLATIALVAAVGVIPSYAANVASVQVNGGTTVASSTQVTTISFTLPQTDVTGATVYYPSTIDDTGFVLGDVTAANAATDIGAAAYAVDTTANTITFTVDGTNTADTLTITLANAHFATPAGNSAITFSVILNETSGSSAGAGVIQIGTGANTVSVTATVPPILTLVLANTTVALGTLSVSGATTSTVDPTATVATNAMSGFTLQLADNATAGLTSAITSGVIPAVADSAQAPGTAGFSVEMSETTDPQTNGSITAGFAAGGGTALTAVAQTIASGTGPTAGYVTTANVETNISAITPAASDYVTTLTFTATGTF
jgi:hypothetical protein